MGVIQVVNINKLRGKIVEHGYNVEKVADLMNIDRSTMYRKMEESGKNITIKDATILSQILHLTSDDVHAIFFDETVA